MTEIPVYHISEEAHPRLQCQTCGRPLNTHILAEEDGGRIIEVSHPVQDKADHRPVPVPIDVATIKAVCDFCSTPLTREATWTCPTAAFNDTRLPYGSSDDFAACEACAELVIAEDRNALTERSLKHLGFRGARAQVLRHFHGLFWANRMGPPFKGTPYG